MGNSRVKALKKAAKPIKSLRPKIGGKKVSRVQTSHFERSLASELVRQYGPPSYQLPVLPKTRLLKVDPKKIRKSLKLTRGQFAVIFGLSIKVIQRAEELGARLSAPLRLIYSWINYDPAGVAELHGYSLRWYTEHAGEKVVRKLPSIKDEARASKEFFKAALEYGHA